VTLPPSGALHTRRAALRGAAAGGVAVALVPLPWREARASQDEALAAAIREAVGEAAAEAAEEGGIVLRVPAVAENGAVVPLAVVVESPMTAADHVGAIHVFATRNPTPGIASFHLTPALGRAEVQTRIRLAEDQRIVVLARHADGRVRRAAAEVRVSVSGCLG
jgi:sulfur-oxidizing protein SoxY